MLTNLTLGLALLAATPDEKWKQAVEMVLAAQGETEAAVKGRCNQLRDYLAKSGGLSRRQIAEAIDDTVGDALADMKAIDDRLLGRLRPLVGDLPAEAHLTPRTLGDAVASDASRRMGRVRFGGALSGAIIEGDPRWTKTYGLMAYASEVHPDEATRETCHRAALAMRKGCNIGILRYLIDVDRCRMRVRADEIHRRLTGRPVAPPYRKPVPLPPDSQIKRQARDAVRAVGELQRRMRALGLPSVYH